MKIKEIQSWMEENIFIRPGLMNTQYIKAEFSQIKRDNAFIYSLLSKKLKYCGSLSEAIYLVYHGIDEYVKCPECGNKPKFVSFNSGYKRYCSSACSNNAYEVKKKKEDTCLKNWGCKNNFQSTETKSKAKETLLKRYGVDNIQKLKETREKTYNTCFEKYGSKTPLQNAEIFEKLKKTNISRYGVECTLQSDLVKENILTNYGTPFYSQTDEYQEKVYKTKKKNSSFNASLPEDMLYELLKDVHPDIVRQYRSDAYPWACDFYIPSEDLYIEYQGSWTHGPEPFDENNEEHIELIQEWSRRSEGTNFKGEKKKYYLNAVETWSKRDVEKRQWAKEHGLNLIEIFNLDELINIIKDNKNIKNKIRNKHNALR